MATIILGALCVFAGCASYITGHHLFPYLSPNHDEGIYLFEARLLQHGHLTLPVHGGGFFRPWASGIRHGHVVLKYSPAWPLVIAIGNVLGDPRLAPAAAAASLVLGSYLLGRELIPRRGAALVASGIMALSPLCVVLSGTYLPYSFQLAIECVAAWLLVSGTRRSSPARLILGGLTFGFAFYSRQFDAVLFAAPFLGWALVHTYRKSRLRWTVPAFLALGATPMVLLFFVSNWVLMGSPTRLQYSITGSTDRLGFGQRGLFDTGTFYYGPSQAAHALYNLYALPTWTLGGVAVLFLAMAGWWASRWTPPWWTLSGLGLSFAVGYFFFWSPYALVHGWSGLKWLGPFYHLAVMVPFALFAARGLDWLSGAFRRRWVVGTAIGLAVLITAVTAPAKLHRDQAAAASLTADARAVMGRVTPPAVVFLQETVTEGFESRTPILEADPDPNAPVRYVRDLGGADFELLRATPTRHFYVVSAAVPNDALLGQFPLVVEPMTVVHGSSMTLTLRFKAKGNAYCVVAYASLDNGALVRQVLTRSSRIGEAYVTAVVVSPTPRLASSGGLGVSTRSLAGPAELFVGISVANDCAAPTPERFELRYQIYGTGSAQLELLEPPSSWHQFQFFAHPPIWIHQVIEPDLVATVNPGA